MVDPVLYLLHMEQVADVVTVPGVPSLVELLYKLLQCLAETVGSADVVSGCVDTVGDGEDVHKRLVGGMLFPGITALLIVPSVVQQSTVADALNFRAHVALIDS